MGGLAKAPILSLLLLSAASLVRPSEASTNWTDLNSGFDYWLWGPEATVTVESLNTTKFYAGNSSLLNRLISLVAEPVDEAVVVLNAKPLWENGVLAFPKPGLNGILVKAEPFHACRTIEPHPEDPTSVEEEIDDLDLNSTKVETKWILIAEEGDCRTRFQMENALKAGYSALLLLSSDPEKREDLKDLARLKIFAAKIDVEDGLNLIENYVYPEPFIGKIEDTRDAQWAHGTWKLVGMVVGVLLVILLILLIIWAVIRYRRKKIEEREAWEFRQSLQRAIENMPITIWELNQVTKDEKCHICYGLFYPNDVVRTMPCYHRFHQRCIISRLDAGNTECVVCHYRLVPHGLKQGKSSESTPLL